MSSTSVKEIKITALNQHIAAMTALFDSGEDFDFTVKCGNRIWQLHRIILCSGSLYFEHAISRRFEERASGIMELEGQDPQYVGILLRYFYAHDYQIDDNGKPPLEAHAQVYAIANRYGVVLLKDLAAAKFSLALKDTGAADIPGVIAAIKVMYTSDMSFDSGLHDCVLPTLKRFRQQLRDSDDFMALFTSGLGDGDFAVMVLDAWAGLSPTICV